MQPSLAEARYADLHAGDQPIPGFRLVRRRGRGGFGEVWEAEASGGFRVALKFVRLSSRARAAELRALEFVRGIHHPNLLANFGSWQVDDTLVIGMELADRSLWERQVEATHQGLRGIPRHELLGYLAEVASGLDHLNGYRHTLDGRPGFGIQHRDLKPSNILLFGGGAKVADLGMARAMDTDVAGHTGIWTFAYAAPEFFRGETTRQSDQYGLAATYCQLRGGRLPFDGGAASMTAGHLFGRPDLGGLPEPERPLVGRALAKVPGDRWPDCRSFVDALRSLPPDSVPDVLADPDGPSDIPREFRSSTGAIALFPVAHVASDDAGPSSGWWPAEPALFPTGTGSSFAEPPGPTGFPPSSDNRPTSAGDFRSTFILSANLAAPEPTPDLSPRPPRRRARIGMGLAAAAVAAITLAARGVHAPTYAGRAPAAPRARPFATTLLLAEGLGSAAEAAPETDEPTSPAPVPLPASPTATTYPPASDRPGSIATAQPDIILEGPIEMNPAAAGASSPPTGPRIGGPSAPNAPAIVGREAGVGTGAGDPGKAVNPPLPGSRQPASASGAVAFHDAGKSIGRPSADKRDGGRAKISPAEAAFLRGEALFGRGSYRQAFAAFDEAVRLDPGYIPSYFPRAISRHLAGDPRASLADYADAIRVKPDDAAAYVSRGAAHHTLADYRRAIADYDEAIRLQPGDPEARFRRGWSRHRMGDHALSIDDFDEALRLDPKHVAALELRAEAIARLVSKNVAATSPVRPPTIPAIPPTETVAATPRGTTSPANIEGTLSPGPKPVVEDRAEVRETLFLATPPAGRNGKAAAGGQARSPAAAARPGAKPAPQDRRRAPGFRIMPWLFPRRK